MVYLRKFENHNNYVAFTESEEFIKPNVSICDEEDEVHYNPYVIPKSIAEVIMEIGSLDASSEFSYSEVGVSTFSSNQDVSNCFLNLVENGGTFHPYGYFSDVQNFIAIINSVGNGIGGSVTLTIDGQPFTITTYDNNTIEFRNGGNYLIVSIETDAESGDQIMVVGADGNVSGVWEMNVNLYPPTGK